MSPKRKAAEPVETPVVSEAPAAAPKKRSPIAGIALTLVLITAMLVLAGWIWQGVRDRLRQSPDYRLSASQLDVTSRPDWIRADVAGEVYRDGSLSQVSLVDDDAVKHIHAAFVLHPWVRSAEVRIQAGSPARVAVAIDYRRPAALVEVSGDALPVDEEGVLLPSDENAARAGDYPRLEGVSSTPSGAAGSKWGDPLVEQGAKLAAALQGAEDVQVVSIRPTDPAATVGAEFHLTTASGQTFLWGHAPGSEAEGELSVEAKLARLRAMQSEGQ